MTTKLLLSALLLVGAASSNVAVAQSTDSTVNLQSISNVSQAEITCPEGFFAIYDWGFKRWTCVIASCGGGNYNNCNDGGNQ